MTSGIITAIELHGNDAIQRWRDIIGPTNTFVAKEKNPQSLRARFGTDQTQNACHGSDSPVNAAIESEFFFGTKKFSPTAKFTNSTLLLIKPHAVESGIAGEVIQRVIDAGYQINALQMFRLDKSNAADFLEVYKTVVPEYSNMVDSLTTGPVLAMEISGSANVVEAVRNMCGPADPDLARLLRPNTIRAKYGENKVLNSVHCTDLEEDSSLEVEFFFNLLQK